MLRRFFENSIGFKNFSTKKSSRGQQKLHFSVDYNKLEDRNLLATTFYFDFGAGLAGGGLNTDTTAFRNIAGAATGTDLALDAGMNAGDDLNIARLNYDFDGNGTAGEVSDMNALAAAAMPLIQRALEPYDIIAEIASASTLADVAATMALNAGDPNGEFDAYNFATTFTSTTLVTGANPTGSVGIFAGLFGLASRPDFNAAAGNFVDEATQSYADTIFNATPGTQGTDAFNANLAQRIAYTATHEGGHTIGFRHASGLEAGGDIERLGSSTRDFPFMLTRFDLNRTDGPAVVNTYDFIAADADMGLRDDNRDGIPDFAFVSGTGAHDLVQITSLGLNSFATSVDAFSNTGMTTFIGNESYNVNLLTDTEGEVLVDGGTNVDRVEIDGTINADFRLRGGQGAEGTSTEADRAVIDLGGASIIVTAFAGSDLSFQVAGGGTFAISEFEFIDLQDVGGFEIIGTNFDDILNLAGTGNANEVEIDLNGNTLTVQADSLLFTGLGGNDQMIVDSTVDLVRLDNGIRYDGGGGIDTLELTQTGGSQTSETIVVGATNGAGTDTIVGPSGTQTVQFENLEPIITNVVAANLFINGGTIGSLLNTDNAINYASSNLFGATWGMVTIDAFEPIHFINKTNLNIDAEAGSDTINLNNPNTPTALTNINIIGNDPAASDTLIVNAVAGVTDELENNPTAQGAGTVVTSIGPNATYTGIEHIVLVVQQADGDEAEVNGTIGDDQYEYLPGVTSDTATFIGTMDTNNATGNGPFALVTTTIVGVDQNADLDINFVGGAGNDSFIFNGTSGNDSIAVTDAGTDRVQIQNTINGLLFSNLDITDIESILVRGHDGSDVFDHEGGVTVNTTYEGGNPSNGSDWLNVTLDNGTTETVTIAPDAATPNDQDITGLAGGGLVNVSGVETIAVNGGNSDDTLVLDPDFSATMRIDSAERSNWDRAVSDSLPEVQWSNLNVFRVTPGGASNDFTTTFVTSGLFGAVGYEVQPQGNDQTLVIEGDGNADSFTVVNPATGEVAITDNNRSKTITSVGNGLDLLRINTLGGDDVVTVGVGGTDLIAVPIEYSGGSGNDSLTVTGAPSVTVNTVTYDPGPTVDAGRLSYDSTGTDMTIDFVGLEPVNDTVVAAALIVNGTNGDNSFSYVADPSNAAHGQVAVDGFEVINFANKTALNLNGQGGTDLFSLNNPSLPTGLTSIVVDGGDPTNGDELQVNGIAGTNDDFIYTPTATGAGGITNTPAATFAPVTFSNVEQLVIAGQSADSDGLRVLSTAGNDNYFWTAGATGDRGFISGDTGTFAITPIRYSQMRSSVTPLSSPIGGTDTLTINGTDADDTFVVSDAIFPPLATAFPSVSVNGGTQLFFHTATNLVKLRGLSGNDTFNTTFQAGNAHSFLIEGGDSDSFSDTLNLFAAPGLTETVMIEPGTVANHQDITGLNSPIESSGVELITFTGENNDDTLIVELEDGFKTALLQDGPDGNGPAYDQLTSTVLPQIRFRDLATFEVDNDDLGEITIITDDLNEATTFLVDGDGDETLIIQGQDAQGDDYTVSLDGSGDVQIVDNNEGVTITTTGIDGSNDHLVLRTQGDDDLVTIDVDGTDLIDVLITYEGGGGNDSLTVTGTPSVTVNNVTYSPGSNVDEGRLFYESTGSDMTIDFTGLEPVTDLVVAAALTVNGTNADNAINYIADPNNANQGQVSVDGFEFINFANKTALNLKGLGGSDLFTINNPNVPTGLTNININGGPGTQDRVTVVGTANADTFTLLAGNLLFNTLNVNFASVDSMLVTGRAGNDTFNVRATSLPVILKGNSGSDTFNVSSNAALLTGNLDGITNPLTLDGGTQANTINVSDLSSNVANQVNVSSSVVRGLAPVAIRYASTGGTTQLNLTGSNTANDYFLVGGLLSTDALTINGGGGADRFVLKSTAHGDTTFNGQAGNDTFKIEMIGNGNRNITVNGGSSFDRLSVFGNNADNTFNLTTTQIALLNEVVNYSSIESQRVTGLSGNDTFNVQSTAAGSPVVLLGNAGADQFNLTGAFPGGNLNSIAGRVIIEGGAGGNTLNVSDQTGPANPNVNITNSAINGFAPANIGFASTDGTFAINLIGSNANDQFTVHSLNADDQLSILGRLGDDVFTLQPNVFGDVALFGNGGVDTFTIHATLPGNRLVTVDGGGGFNFATVNGTQNNDAYELNTGAVVRGTDVVNYSRINQLQLNTLGGSDSVELNAGAATTILAGQSSADRFYILHTNGIANLTVNAGSGADHVFIMSTNAATTSVINTQFGFDTVDIGSSLSTDFGNLDRIKGPVMVNGGLGQDQLYMNDRAAVGKFNYEITPNAVTNSASGPLRSFAGVMYNGLESLRLDGTDQRNVFRVTPSLTTNYFVDGNRPSQFEVNASSEGDFLQLVTVPNDGHRLILTDRDTGTGRWRFTNGQQTVNFTEIERFNHVERLAIGADSNDVPWVKVYDAETRNKIMDIFPYEAGFRGGVRVATGDVNADGIPDIIVAPGPGRQPEVKIFDGWDGTEINSFFAFDPHIWDGVHVAAGDVIGNKGIDVVVGAGAGRLDSAVSIFRNSNRGQTFTEMSTFFPYGESVEAGTSVAVGDIDADGIDDIVTAPLNGWSQIAVFAGSRSGNHFEMARFLAFDEAFRGGAFIAVGNVTGNAQADIIVSSDHNVFAEEFSSNVHIYDGWSLQTQPETFIAPDFAFKAYPDAADNPRASVRVAVKDFDLDGVIDEIITGQSKRGDSNFLHIFEPGNPNLIDTLFEDFDGVFVG